MNADLISAVGFVGGLLGLLSAAPQLWQALRHGAASLRAYDPPQIASRAAQLAGNLLLTLHAGLRADVWVALPFGVMSLLLAALLWVLLRAPRPVRAAG